MVLRTMVFPFVCSSNIVSFFFPDVSSFEWFFLWFYIFERLIALLMREHARDGK
jgi:hypothetical protein